MRISAFGDSQTADTPAARRDGWPPIGLIPDNCELDPSQIRMAGCSERPYPLPPGTSLTQRNLPLPAKSPELNPVENIWQFMRDNWLSNRVFSSYEDILDHCCFAWNKLIDQPWKIISIGTREWVYGSSST